MGDGIGLFVRGEKQSKVANKSGYVGWDGEQ